VIVVDDGASDETQELVQRRTEAWRANGGQLRYLRVEGAHGPAAARNAGWRASRGRLVAFTDDDCIPDPDWLEAGLDACRDGASGASGKIVVPIPPIPTDYERSAAALEEAKFATANCFYRRDALAAVGGFDQRFTVAWREDSDLFLSLLERGHHLVEAPRAVVVHPVRPARWGVSLRQQRKSLFNALLYKKHPKLYRAHIQSRPPLLYYCAALALLTAFGSAVKRQSRILGAFGGLWLVLTVRFCALRLRGTSRTRAHVLEMTATSVFIPVVAVFWRLRGAIRFRVLFL
jgi:GT2 family glycosyltransferase